MSEATTQAFDRAEFERALAVLGSEQRALHLSRAQRISYRLYTVFLWGFVICVLGAFIAALFTKDNQPGKADVAMTVFIVAFMVCLLGGILSFFLNLPLIIKIFRQRQALRRTGFSDASEVLWKKYRTTRRWGRTVERIALGLVIICLVTVVALVVTKQGPWTWLPLLLAVLFLMLYVLQNGKARLDMMSARLAEVTRLKESMQNMAGSEGWPGTERIALPDDVIQQYSWVETEQIARSRAKAITDSLQAKTREFSVLSSQQVRQAKSGLAPDDRLKVEAALDALMRDPRPASAEQEAGTGMLKLQVNGTGLELVYSADDSSLQLKVATLQPSAVGSTPHA